MKTGLPRDISFHAGPRLMIYRPRGILNETRLREIVHFLEEAEDRAAGPFNRFTDLSKLDALDVEFKSMISISLHRRLSYTKHPPVKSAFYVTSPAAARVVKVHVLLTDHSPLQTKMFTELAAAAKWLGVLPDILKPRKGSGNGEIAADS